MKDWNFQLHTLYYPENVNVITIYYCSVEILIKGFIKLNKWLGIPIYIYNIIMCIKWQAEIIQCLLNIFFNFKIYSTKQQ